MTFDNFNEKKMKYKTFKIKANISSGLVNEKQNRKLICCSYFFENRRKKIVAAVGLFYHSDSDEKATIENLYVLPKYRKSGLATRLMEFVCENHGHQTLRLFPWDEDDLGIDLYKFYGKFGFERTHCDYMIREKRSNEH